MTNELEIRRIRVIEEARFLVRFYQSLPKIAPPRKTFWGMDIADTAQYLLQVADEDRAIFDRIRQLKVAVEMLDEVEKR